MKSFRVCIGLGLGVELIEADTYTTSDGDLTLYIEDSQSTTRKVVARFKQWSHFVVTERDNTLVDLVEQQRAG